MKDIQIKNISAISFLLLAISVALGAFGAHGAKQFLSPTSLKMFNTATQYFTYHAISLALWSFISKLYNIKKNSVVIHYLIGILLFSGGLYTYSFTHIKFFMYIVPIGGISFILGHLLAFYYTLKIKS